MKVGDFGQAKPWRLHAWTTYASRKPTYVDIDAASEDEDVENHLSDQGQMLLQAMTMK